MIGAIKAKNISKASKTTKNTLERCKFSNLTSSQLEHLNFIFLSIISIMLLMSGFYFKIFLNFFL